MSVPTFPRSQMVYAFRRFKDLSQYVLNSRYQTWLDNLAHLINHCENDPVMNAVTDPLRSNLNVDAEKWVTEAIETRGTNNLATPLDNDDRMALLYKLCMLMSKDAALFENFMIDVFSTGYFQKMVDIFNSEYVLKFVRDVSHRLDDFLENTKGEQNVPREAVNFMFNHNNSINIHGSIQGSNVALGSSSISGSSAKYESAESLVAAFNDLSSLVRE